MAIGGEGGGGGVGQAVEAGRAYVTAFLNDGPLKSGLESVRKVVLGFGKTVIGAGAGLAGIGAAITGPLVGAAQGAADRFNEIRKAADQLGTTPEIFSGLAFAVKRFGIDTDGLVTASRRMEKFVSEANQGGAAADTLKEIGLNAETLIKLPLDEQFKAIADGIKNLGTEADRQRVTLDIFGRSGGALAPLMRQGAAGISDLIAKGKDIGAIVTKDQAETAKRYSAALNQIKASIGFTIEAVGAAALPTLVAKFERLASILLPILKQLREFIEENGEIIALVLTVGTVISGLGTAFIVVGTAITLFGVALGGVVSLLTFLVSTPVLITAALVTLGVVLVALVADFGDLEKIVEGVGGLFKWLADIFGQTWGGIKDALAAGDLSLALQNAVAGLDVIWKALLVQFTKAWVEFKNQNVDTWLAIAATVELAWEKMVSRLAQNIAKAMAEIARLRDAQEEAADFDRRAAEIARQERLDEEIAKRKFQQDMDDRHKARQREIDDAERAEGRAAIRARRAAEEAATAKNTKLFADFMKDIAETKFNFPGAAAVIAEAGSSRGAFAGRDIGRQFAVASADRAKEIANNTKRTADGVDEMKDNVGGLRVD